MRGDVGEVLQLGVDPLEPLGAVLQLLVEAPALGDVLADDVEAAVLGRALPGPEDVAPHAVAAADAADELDRRPAARHALDHRMRRRLVVGVDEVEVGRRRELFVVVAERPVPRRVVQLQIAVEARGAEQIDRERKEACFAGHGGDRLTHFESGIVPSETPNSCKWTDLL